MSKIKEAYEWVERFNISFIKNVGILQGMTIRKLKAIALKMNKQLGLVITKAAFGKSYSNMKKKELIDAIWFVRSVQLAAPKGQFELKQLTKRIFAMVCDPRTEYEQAHTYYFGFKSNHKGTAQQQANLFCDRLWQAKGCELVSSRKADRLSSFGYEWEVKVWGIKGSVLESLFAKDVEPVTPIVKPTILPEPKILLPGSQFLVIDDSRGWLGRTGEVVKHEGSTVWAYMDNTPGGKVDFKVSQLQLTKEVDIDTHIRVAQKMYDNVKGKNDRLVNDFVAKINSWGLQVVNDVVDVRF